MDHGGPGLGQITWQIVLAQKNEKKFHGNREIAGE